MHKDAIRLSYAKQKQLKEHAEHSIRQSNRVRDRNVRFKVVQAEKREILKRLRTGNLAEGKLFGDVQSNWWIASYVQAKTYQFVQYAKAKQNQS